MKNVYEVDVPIKNSDNDELNRSKFVKILYDSIIDYGKNEDECLVIGLMGEWGCGKTSIINMVYEKIDEFNKKQKPGKQWIRIKFNPWYFSNQNSIFYHFLDFLMVEFNKTDPINKIITDLSKFKDKLSHFSFNASVVGTGFGISYDNPDVDSNIYKSFNSLKNELMESFYGLKYNIVISIDDIDRLSDQEIQQIFLLVKALADFPNVIYILSFDKQVALKALNNLQVYSPEKFLEKIIQIPIRVPEITKSRLDLIIENKLKPIYEKNNKLEYNNFEEIFALIRPFFVNIRDLKRYTNVLKFYLNQFKDEVNIGDFLLMIAIQVFEDKFYHEIKENKGILTDYGKIIQMDDTIMIKVYEDFLSNFLNPSKYGGNFKDVLNYLFPVIKEYSEEEQGYLEEHYNCDLNIGSNIHFDKYFTFSVEDDEISQIEIEGLLNLDDSDTISEKMLEIIDKGKSRSLLDKLKSNVYKLDRNQCKSLIYALFDIGDNIEHIQKLYSVLDSLCYNLGYESGEVLVNALDSAKSFYTFCYFIHETGYKYGLYYADESKSDSYCYLSFDEFKMLKDLSFRKIIIWANEGILLEKDNCKYFLDFWQKWGIKQELLEFVKISTDTDKKLVSFIEKFKINSKESVYETDIYGDTTFDWYLLNEFIDDELLEHRIKKILEEENLSESELELCKIFIARCNEGGA